MNNLEIERYIEKREYAIDAIESIINFMRKIDKEYIFMSLSPHATQLRVYMHEKVRKMEDEIKSSGCIFEPYITKGERQRENKEKINEG